MKTFFSLALVLLLVAVAAVALSFTIFRPGFPTQRVIENREGEELEVTVQGKVDEALVVDRVSDERRFTIPIRDLGLTDRIFAHRLPERAAPEKAKPKPKDPYIVNRHERIAELEKERVSVQKEIDSGEASGMILRKRRNELDDIDREIRELGNDIDDYKDRNKME